MLLEGILSRKKNQTNPTMVFFSCFITEIRLIWVTQMFVSSPSYQFKIVLKLISLTGLIVFVNYLSNNLETN